MFIILVNINTPTKTKLQNKELTILLNAENTYK